MSNDFLLSLLYILARYRSLRNLDMFWLRINMPQNKYTCCQVFFPLQERSWEFPIPKRQECVHDEDVYDKVPDSPVKRKKKKKANWGSASLLSANALIIM